jgi:hypothetical protein
MKPIAFVALAAFATSAVAPAAAGAQVPGAAPVTLEPGRLRLHGVSASAATHEGRSAVRLVEANGRRDGGLAIVDPLSFQDGEIAIDVAGRRGALAVPNDRGFVGLAFRVSADAGRYESIYLRPDNGRADDQVRRNHSTQYVSHPDFPWPLLRKNFPEKYESYVDLQPGVWTSMRIVVRGAAARLYVHGSDQPTLVVNDLKLPPGPGGVALWIGPGTEAFFANLRIGTAAPASPPPR